MKWRSTETVDGMTEELKKHLICCENAMHSATQVLAQHAFPTDPRTLTVIGFISVLVEHQESILLLIVHGNTGSASTLVRPVVEGAFRALWINRAATDAEVKRFNERDVIDLKFGDVAAALDNTYGGSGMFQSFKTRTWGPLNSYTHGGMHQIWRRFNKGEVANKYSEEDIREITTLVTLVVLLTISLFLEKHGHASSVNRVRAILRGFDPEMGASAS